MSGRFARIDNNPAYPSDEETQWWWDTARPWKGAATDGQPYIAVQLYREKNPNDFVRIGAPMKILFTDQAEYYFVCPSCYQTFADMQWSGSTSGGTGWQGRAASDRDRHQRDKGWCEFCDPVFGSGGWRR